MFAQALVFFRPSTPDRNLWFLGIIDVWNNTPNNPPTRAQIAQFGDNYLLNGDPSSPFFYGYNFYHIQTDFEYVGLLTDLGNGWKFDTKVYTYRYWNKQNYNNSATSIVGNVGVDKLNGYRHAGDIATLSQESKWGVLRVGAWYEWAYTDRYQSPATRQRCRSQTGMLLAPGSAQRSGTK